MRASLRLLFLIGLLVGLSGSAIASAPSKTEVVRWSPFDASGALKPNLRVKTVEGGCGDIGYTLIGGIGYRCAFGHYLVQPCFRDGANPTEYVICAPQPWDRSVIQLHARHLLLYPGVTFTAASTAPWAIVLADGNRCTAILTGSGPIPTPRGQMRDDYGCEQGGVELADLQRNHGLWMVSAVRWTAKSGYGTPRYVPVRRAYLGALPPPMERQNIAASKAYAAAVRIIHDRQPKAHLDLSWVRLALPQANWAYVIFTPADATYRGYFALLHRIHGRWKDASAEKPYCTRLPPDVTRQLFLPKSERGFRPSDSEPRGGTLC